MKLLILLIFLVGIPICQNKQMKVNKLEFLENNSEFDQTYLWGTYKPHLIHAISQRDILTNNPITLSMMYYNPDNLNSESDLKYLVKDSESSDIIYDFEIHDGKKFSVHRTIDPSHNLNLTNTFMKLNYTDTLQSWVSLTKNYENNKNSSKDYRDNKRIGLVFILALEAFEEKSELDKRYINVDSKDMSVSVIDPQTNKNEYFLFRTKNNDKWLNINETNYGLLNNDKKINWKISQTIFDNISRSKSCNVLNFLSNLLSTSKNGNDNDETKTLFYINYIFNINDNFEVTIEYNNKNPKFTEKNYISELKQNKIDFSNTFLNKFGNVNKNEKNSAFQLNCGASSLSNLLGGLLYVYGNLKCNDEKQVNCVSYKPMFSHTPSRKGFPRPFMWDEGFHNLVTCRWHPEICLQSVKDWLGTIDPSSGWIPREQPRGAELRSFIERLKEDNREANPPTFLMDLIYLSKNNKNLLTKTFTREDWGLLKTWYNWWYNLQGVFGKDGAHENLFKWWGPDPSYNLGSGMDDFPRNDGNYVGKYNIDASVWAYFFTNSLWELSSIYESDKDYIQNLSNRTLEIKNNIFNKLLDKSDYIFKDRLVHQSTKKEIFSHHTGYPNLFPFIFGLLDKNSKELEATLKFISDKNTIWTDYGLRSLNKQDEYFGVKSNYWRGPIWINLNYLVLRGLKVYYYNDNKAAQVIYDNLRNNLISTICKEKLKRGYFFEHYNQKLDGRGGGNFPFNGWTSLITLVISEDY